MTNYEMFLNRITNGKPFTKSAATERVQTLANNLEINKDEENELMTIINDYGLDVLPNDAMGRIANLELEHRELIKTVEAIQKDVEDLQLKNGGSVKPGGDIPYDPIPTPKPTKP